MKHERITEESMKAMVDKEFKGLNEDLINKATDRVAKDIATMDSPQKFIKAVDYVNTLPKKERRFMVMRLMSGTMMFYAHTMLGPDIAQAKTKGMYQ